MTAEAGMVMIQAHKILRAIPQRTADNLLVAPTPMIEPATTWVVLTGIPPKLAPKITTAEAVSAANPCTG